VELLSEPVLVPADQVDPACLGRVSVAILVSTALVQVIIGFLNVLIVPAPKTRLRFTCLDSAPSAEAVA
jgi:hypothetical protein